MRRAEVEERDYDLYFLFVINQSLLGTTTTTTTR